MSICDYCNREMLEADSCTGMGFPDGSKPIPYGQEQRYTAEPPKPDQRCHDCGVKAGGLHHPGCDYEECPRCHWQAIGCGCFLVEEEEGRKR